jgi:hypothetical protein
MYMEHSIQMEDTIPRLPVTISKLSHCTWMNTSLELLAPCLCELDLLHLLLPRAVEIPLSRCFICLPRRVLLRLQY